MGVIRHPRQAVLPSSGRSTDTSNTNTANNTDTESVASSGTVTPVPGNTRGPGVCPVQVRRNLGSHNVRMKQGRRTKQRWPGDQNECIMIMDDNFTSGWKTRKC